MSRKVDFLNKLADLMEEYQVSLVAEEVFEPYCHDNSMEVSIDFNAMKSDDGDQIQTYECFPTGSQYTHYWDVRSVAEVQARKSL